MATGTHEKEMKRQGSALKDQATEMIRTSNMSDSPMKVVGGLLKAALGAFLGLAGSAHGKMEKKKR